MSGSGIAHGYSIRVHPAWSMLAIAARTREFSGIPTENRAPAFETACRMAEEQYAESARTRTVPSAPQRRAVVIASRIIRTAPWADGAAPRRNRVAAITGAASAVEMVASCAFNPRTFV